LRPETKEPKEEAIHCPWYNSMFAFHVALLLG